MSITLAGPGVATYRLKIDDLVIFHGAYTDRVERTLIDEQDFRDFAMANLEDVLGVQQSEFPSAVEAYTRAILGEA